MLLLFLLRDGSISEPRAGKVKTGDADKRIGKAAGTQHRPEVIEVRNKKRKGIGNINDLHDKHEHLRNKPELFHRGAAFLRQDEDKQQRGSGQKPEQIPRAEPEYQAIYPIQYYGSGGRDGGLLTPEHVRGGQPDQSAEEERVPECGKIISASEVGLNQLNSDIDPEHRVAYRGGEGINFRF